MGSDENDGAAAILILILILITVLVSEWVSAKLRHVIV